ncbi:MAG: flagellar protein FlaG [Lachnospiraceae bacterium]|nr:flagellar protein FlaG [Lachnospiraceae bacterium]
MAIEPLNSAMSYTVQPVSRPQPASGGTEATEAQTIETNAPQVDAKTISVSKPQTEEGDKKDEEKGQQGQQSQQVKQKVSDDQIKSALDELNRKQSNFISEFGIHEKTNRITVKIVDKSTKEVIKELPPEKMLDMIAKVWEYAGLVVDEKR